MKDIPSVEGISNFVKTVTKRVTYTEAVIVRYHVPSEVGPQCTERAQGYRFFWYIWHDLASSSYIQLDFTGVTSYSRTFFDASFGNLLKYFRLSALTQRVHPENLSPAGWKLLQATLHRCRENRTWKGEADLARISLMKRKRR